MDAALQLHVPKGKPPTITPAKSRAMVRPVGQVIQLRQRNPWREASESARATAIAREIVVSYLNSLLQTGTSQNNAIKLLLERAASEALPAHYHKAVQATAKADRAAPTRSTICLWLAAYKEQGIAGLLPTHKGRIIESPAWYGPALEIYNQPSKPDIAAVHRYITEVEGHACNYEQVRSYLNSVPAQYGRSSPARLGKKLYRLTQKAYIRRSTEHALPGDCYVADGYAADVYLAHPMTGKIWRPEITAAIDLRSRYLVGWRADEHEGTHAVQNMWAESFTRHGHVPPMLYIDNGSGHKNQYMSCAETGFYARAGVIEIIHALPFNPHGKGWVERLFRTFKDDFLKLEWPQFYCGKDAAPEQLQRVVREVNAGRLQLPGLAEYKAAFNAWLDRYHSRPHPEDKTRSRAEMWAELEQLPPCQSVTELQRRESILTVRRASITKNKREYGHAELHAYNGKKIKLEYDMFDNSIGICRDLSGRWICDAHLINPIDAIAGNRLDNAREQRMIGQINRKERAITEVKARAGKLIDARAVAEDAMQILQPDKALQLPAREAITLDLSLTD